MREGGRELRDIDSRVLTGLQRRFSKEGMLHKEFHQRIAKGAGGKGSTSKIVKKCQTVFRHFSTIFAQGKKNVKYRQKASKSFSTLFDNFRAAPFFRPLLGGSDFMIGKFLNFPRFSPTLPREPLKKLGNSHSLRELSDPGDALRDSQTSRTSHACCPCS